MMSEVWNLDLQATQKLVLLAMADHADDEGGNAYPSVARLAEKCSVDPRTVQRTLRALEASGLLVVVRHATQHAPTTYKVSPGAAQCRGGNLPDRQSIPPGVTSDPARGGTVPPESSGTIRNHPSSGDAGPPPRPDRYEQEFATEVRPLYPSRTGDQRWQAALSSFRAARKAGEALEAIVGGVRRYRAFCDATGKTGTERTKQAGSFFGREKCWREPWDIPPPAPREGLAWKNSRAPVEPVTRGDEATVVTPDDEVQRWLAKERQRKAAGGGA